MAAMMVFRSMLPLVSSVGVGTIPCRLGEVSVCILTCAHGVVSLPRGVVGRVTVLSMGVFRLSTGVIDSCLGSEPEAVHFLPIIGMGVLFMIAVPRVMQSPSLSPVEIK